MGILATERFWPQWGLAFEQDSAGRLFIDVTDDFPSPVPGLLRRQMTPARQGRQIQNVPLLELSWLQLFARSPGLVFGAAVAPGSHNRLALRQSIDALQTWPVSAAQHQSLLGSMAQEVAQAPHLGSLFVADPYSSKPAAPEPGLPAARSSCLAGKVAVEVGHESGEVLGLMRGEEDVEMVAQPSEGMDVDRKELLRPGHDASGDCTEFLPGRDEEAALNAARGDLEGRAARGYIA